MKPYRELLARLYRLNRVDKIKYDTSRVEALCAFYGSPQDHFPCIHVTGTNGKGSVTFKLGQVMRESGLRTGVFQSPHVTTFRERIAVDDQLVEESFVGDFLQDVFAHIDAGRVTGSFFEVLTTMAFVYFRQKKVDVACVEVGIGGRLDATNALSRSLLSVVTSVGLDHCELLGDTVEKITREKCGIIRPGSAALAGPTVPRAVFEEACAAAGAESNFLAAEAVCGKSFEEINNRIVEEAAAILRRRGLALRSIEPEWLQRNLKCRMEAVPAELLGRRCPCPPLAVYLDVGHNPQATAYLLRSLEHRHPGKELFIVYGTSAKKDSRATLEQMATRVSSVTLIQAQSPRAKSVEDIAAEAVSLPISCKTVKGGDIAATLGAVFSSPEVQGRVVVICGSFFIMEEARFFLGYDDPHDPFFLNELFPIPSAGQQSPDAFL